jgi:hypothetical protein
MREGKVNLTWKSALPGMPSPDSPAPPPPSSIEETGLPESLIEELLLKILYFRGELFGQDLSKATGLRFSVIEPILEALKLRHQVQIKRSLGISSVGSLLALTEAGRMRARECLEINQYVGPAPVPLSQYADRVRQQRPPEGWLTSEQLLSAFRGMVLTQQIVSQIGPAISGGSSLLLYGKPGDGKTFLVEALQNLNAALIYLPYAIECQGNIILLYDPIYHHQAEEEDNPSVLAVSEERSYDRRFAKCRRPFIVSGGELSLDMLDLQYNHTSHVYEAPFQLKANNGIYLIDDFGRQRVSPAEILNRWIVPMGRRVDYLTFLTGGKMTVPFETFLVFSTNLNPADLGDEAFLRRIQYKMYLPGPTENEFIKIFETFCRSRKLPCTRDLIVRFIDRRFRQTGKTLRRCHPRDVLTHAINLIHFEKLPYVLNDEILDRAFESCFVHEEQEAAPQESILLPVMADTCADHFGDQTAKIPTAFGTLVFLAGFRSRSTGQYYDADSFRQYGDAETVRVLHRMHLRAFSDWLSLNPEQQRRDLGRYLASSDAASRAKLERKDFINLLAPAGAKAQDVAQFLQDFTVLLSEICGAKPETPEPSSAAPPDAVERIA